MHASLSISLSLACCVFVVVCVYVHVYAHAHEFRYQEGQRHSIPLEVELAAGVSHLMWVLGNKFKSSPRATIRAVCALNYRAISPTPQNVLDHIES